MLPTALHAATPIRLVRLPLDRLAHLPNNAAILTATAVLSVFAGLGAIFSGWYFAIFPRSWRMF